MPGVCLVCIDPSVFVPIVMNNCHCEGFWVEKQQQQHLEKKTKKKQNKKQKLGLKHLI